MITVNPYGQRCGAGGIPLETGDQSGRFQFSSPQNSVDRPEFSNERVSDLAYPLGARRNFLPHFDGGDPIIRTASYKGHGEASAAMGHGGLESREFSQSDGLPVAVTDRSRFGDYRVAVSHPKLLQTHPEV